MHDTAFRIGGLVINNYCPQPRSSILEIGSLDVNGSLRNHAGAEITYVGIDYSAGKGVDHVINNDQPWPVEDGSFDLVIASSVFEHDEFFWETFSQMVRKTKLGGFIYINVPSNGWVHRYPLDCWRFYPDCGGALARWADRQGYPVTLVESFVAEREADVWNDFCAVFRREPSSTDLPQHFIHQRVPSVNAVTWLKPDLEKVREQPQDMVLVEFERSARLSTEADVERLSNYALQVNQKLAAVEADLSEATAAAEKNRAKTQELEESLTISQQALEVEREEIKELRSRNASLLSEVRAATALKLAAQNQLHERFAELAALTIRLRRIEAENQTYARQNSWTQHAISVMAATPGWWQLMPKAWREERKRKRLYKLGVFDGNAYLQRYPDVAAAKMDPFNHYLRHGIKEGRVIDRGGA